MKNIVKNILAIVLLSILLLSIYSFTPNNPQIKGKINLTELPVEISLLQYDFNTSHFVEIQTLQVNKKGEFSCDLTGNMPRLFQLKVAGQKIEFPVDDISEITMEIDSTDVQIIGSKQVKAIENFKKLINNANERYFGDLIKSATNQEKMQDKEYTKKLMNLYKNERLSAFYAELEQAIDNMDYSLAALYCLNYLDMNKNFQFIDKKIEVLNTRFQTSGIMNGWNKKLENARKIQPGEIAPWNEETKDLSGNVLNLNTLKGKYLVIDFWAGWCKPCLIEISFYKEIYQKYHAKGLEMIGINLDFKEEQCKNMQNKFKMPWPVVYDHNKVISNLYMVSQLPQNVVIDKTGKIIAKNLLVWEIEDLLKEKMEL